MYTVTSAQTSLDYSTCIYVRHLHPVTPPLGRVGNFFRVNVVTGHVVSLTLLTIIINDSVASLPFFRHSQLLRVSTGVEKDWT